MAQKRTASNGHDRLDEAMAMLIQNEAAFVGRLSENERLRLEFQREATERFARLEQQMAEIIRVLSDHGRLLEHLPEAVRDKIGIKGEK